MVLKKLMEPSIIVFFRKFTFNGKETDSNQ